MIDDLGLRSPLSNIRIQPVANGSLKAFPVGGKVENLKKTDTGIEFDWTAKGLPWVLPEEAQPGARLLHLGHKASKEGLEVHGLESGNYELVIDDVVVGSFTNVALSRHIELQENDRTPQYQQALNVAMLNKQKNEGPVKSLRDGWRLFQSWARHSRELGSQPNNKELEAVTAKERIQLQGLEENIQNAEAAAEEIENEIYKVNQPVTRHYTIRKVQ